MKTKLLVGAATVTLAGAYVVNDNEFRLAFDRNYKLMPKSKSEDPADKELQLVKDKGLQFMKGLESDYVMIRNCRNNMICGYFIPSKTESKKYVILSHGYRNTGLNEFAAFIPFYYEENINMLIIDHQGHGNSEGRYITFGYQEHKDILRWIDYLVENHGQDIEVYLHGISMGASTVLQVSGSEFVQPQVKGIISDCAYTNAQAQLVHTMDLYHVPFSKATYKTIASKLERLTGARVDEVNAVESVKRSQIPTVFIHGLDDTFVPTNMAVEIFDACACDDKDLILVEKAGHALSYWYAKDLYHQAILDIMKKEK